MQGNNYGFSPYNNYRRNDYQQRREFVQGYNSNRNQYSVQKRKHSGCKAGNDRNGQPFVRGWKFDRRHGLRSFLAVPYKGTSEHTSNSGRVWYNWMVKISAAGSKPEIVSGLYDPSSGKVIIRDLSFVMNPRASNGGYVGSFIKRKN